MKKPVTTIIALASLLTACGSSDKKVQTPVMPSEKAAMADSVPDTIISASLQAEPAAENEEKKQTIQPVTQFMLVQVGEFGTVIRGEKDLKNRLKTIGFDAAKFPATRKGANGKVTSVNYNDNGEDRIINIMFADEAERDAFMESLKKSGWQKDGHVWAHPSNQPGMGTAYAKINGNTATVIQPFEMLPSNF